MQNVLTKITLLDDEGKHSSDALLPCSLSLGHVDYFSFYLEQRVTEHVLKYEQDEKKSTPCPTTEIQSSN
jgi:hypothetical protein